MSAYKVIEFGADKLPQAYVAMVYSKWLRSLRYGNDYFRLINQAAYYEAYHEYLRTILARATVRLAVLGDDADVVLGFLVHRGPTLDYVHVHKDMRRQGIARSLLPAGVDTITHVTHTGMSIWGSKFPAWKFNPFAE